jgi:hypothetical protein
MVTTQKPYAGLRIAFQASRPPKEGHKRRYREVAGTARKYYVPNDSELNEVIRTIQEAVDNAIQKLREREIP